MIVTLCGSSKFKDKFDEINKELTLQGHIVLAPAFYHHVEEDIELTQEQKIQLDNLHKEKIDMSDAIFVINVDKYIGKSTYGEIDWAYRKKKEVYFLVPMEEKKEGETTEDSAEAATPAPAQDSAE